MFLSNTSLLVKLQPIDWNTEFSFSEQIAEGIFGKFWL